MNVHSRLTVFQPTEELCSARASDLGEIFRLFPVRPLGHHLTAWLFAHWNRNGMTAEHFISRYRKPSSSPASLWTSYLFNTNFNSFPECFICQCNVSVSCIRVFASRHKNGTYSSFPFSVTHPGVWKIIPFRLSPQWSVTHILQKAPFSDTLVLYEDCKT